MRAKMLLPRGTALLVWLTAGALLAACVGALFGFGVGLALALIYGSASAIVPAVVRVAISAAGAGAILAAFYCLSADARFSHVGRRRGR
jgi:hypothetical protein